ncbi:hypothetical protein SAMD00023353_1701570 [Rosellinia necatrix]|uniref:Uncharacterized protein n=1 Tax=Rosellinia necatrix TaxID=77044 RepID=A0A1S8A7J0_ROSNE|nr:hypothetical protein SAMD00023353_1701570 [Rosellinia necatrix]
MKEKHEAFSRQQTHSVCYRPTQQQDGVWYRYRIVTANPTNGQEQTKHSIAWLGLLSYSSHLLPWVTTVLVLPPTRSLRQSVWAGAFAKTMGLRNHE